MHRIKKIILFIFSGALISGTALGQRANQDVVYLTNGSVIRGTLQSPPSEEQIALKTQDQSVWVFEKTAVDSVTKEPFPSRIINFSPDGVYGRLGLGFMFGRHDYGINFDGMLVGTIGYQWNVHNAIGFQFGPVSYDDGLLHTAIEYRRYLNDKPTSPYLMTHAGYTIPPKRNTYWREYSGGVNTGLHLGLRSYISNNTAIDTSIGYDYQNTRYRDYSWGWEDWSSLYINHYHRISLNVGFLFN